MNRQTYSERVADLFLCRVFLATISLFFLLMVMNCHATVKNESRCVDPAVLKTILSDFKIHVVGVNDKIRKRFTEKDRCDDGIFKQVILSLDFIRQYDTPDTPSMFKSNALNDRPYHYLKTKIKFINIREKEHPDCIDGSLGFVSVENIFTMVTDKINLCADIINNEIFFVAYIIIHESGHADGTNHIVCSHGFFEGYSINQCEASMERQSASKEALSFLSLVYANTSEEKLKKQLRKLIIFDLTNRFNSPPFGIRRGVLLVDTNNTIIFYDGENEYTLANFDKEITGATIYAGELLVFMRNGSVFRYEYTREWSEVNESERDYKFISSYKKIPREIMNEISDLVVTNRGLCIISSYTLMCGRDGEALKELDASYPYTFHSAYRAVDYYSKGYTLVDLDYNVFTIMPLKINETVLKQPVQYDLTPRPDLQLHYYGAQNYSEFTHGTFLGVSELGKLLFKKSQDEKWVVDKRFGDRKFRKVLPFYWVRGLENI
ncbi:hypothetical protein AAH332_002345 [Klebsiella aerogenes]